MRAMDIPPLASVLTTSLTALVALGGAIVAILCLYQVTLAVAAFFYRDDRPGAVGRQRRGRLTVLVPAHNESAVIARCIRSLRNQTYEPRGYDVVVVADNCTDDTAAVAEAEGADVLVRADADARGKGYALRWAMDRLLAASSAPDAVVVVDADSEADERFLATLASRYEGGADAVQGESLLEGEASPRAALRAAAFLLVNRTRPAGRAALGLPSHLAGNGMLFSRELLARIPWDAYTSAEDAEYALQLRSKGIRPVFARGAILRSPAAPTADAAKEQQLRWEGGKLHLARTRALQLLRTATRTRNLGLVDAAVELAIPPLGILTALAAAGAALATALALLDVAESIALAPWLVALVAIPVYVLVGLRAANAPGWAYRSLLRAPALVAMKTLRLGRAFRFRGDRWVRTLRAEEDAGSLKGPDRGDRRR
jgi:1,2-diacylglycerol 3-beta-glucosyltransferase